MFNFVSICKKNTIYLITRKKSLKPKISQRFFFKTKLKKSKQMRLNLKAFSLKL